MLKPAELGIVLILASFVIVPLGLLLGAAIDIARRPSESWPNGETDRLVWLLIVVFVAVVGPILYFVAGRRLARPTAVPPPAPAGPAQATPAPAGAR